MREIATIGFGKKGVERFVDLLAQAGVTLVIDTRRRPDSPLSAYARKRDLPFLLQRTAGIRYEHMPELAPPGALLDRYRADKDWVAYVRDFEGVLDSPEAVAAMTRLIQLPDKVALLCSEPTPENCHRRLVAERMQTLSPGLAIDHLV